MTKSPPRLTKIQSKALDFIRSSLERTGTAPTLRELCGFMGYSAIGSAQDLVAALRRKGFLHTPDKQSARSLVLTSKAIALHEPSHQSTEDTYIIHCLDKIARNSDPLETKENRVGTLRMSVGMFDRPFPAAEKLFAWRASGNAMLEQGICDGDWLVIHRQDTVEPGKIALIQIGDSTLVRNVARDRCGVYYRSDDAAYPILRDSDELVPEILGQIIGLQRVLLF